MHIEANERAISAETWGMRMLDDLPPSKIRAGRGLQRQMPGFVQHVQHGRKRLLAPAALAPHLRAGSLMAAA
jgi:hypothetical protein